MVLLGGAADPGRPADPRSAADAAMRREILDTLVIRTVLPLVALVFGTAAIGSEIEDGTVDLPPRQADRPLADRPGQARGRGRVDGRARGPADHRHGAAGRRLRRDIDRPGGRVHARGLLGGTAYAVAFAALGVVTSRALIVGLGYTLIWEGVLAGHAGGHAVPVDPPGDARHGRGADRRRRGRGVLAPVVSAVIIVGRRRHRFHGRDPSPVTVSRCARPTEGRPA